MSRSRQLAAIMFTDIQGYTALMQQNEVKAVEARDKHRLIFNSVTEKYKGRILQYYGDGTLSIFDSAFDAVTCAIEMQLGFQEDPVIPVRIGIHTGDIIFSEEEIIGDSVNVASRIESLAIPGSIFISDKLYDEIKNQESIKTVFLKTFSLKNVKKPIGVYAISNAGLIVPEKEETVQPTLLPQQRSTPFLATKLYIPPPRIKGVKRPHLIERLTTGLHGKLTLISAPAGFGKTTLISQWIAASDRPAAWLSLDENDDEATRFLGYLVAALQTIEGIPADFGQKVLGLLQSPQPQPIESILTVLVNEISTLSIHFSLVLDDYHAVDSPSVDNMLTFLLNHLPQQMHLIITTREDPQLPISRLRVRNKLTELRASDLRFTSTEAAEFLNQGMGLHLSKEDINSLENRTEGWIAGLQMAALSLQGRTDTDSFIKAFTGSNHFILGYLVEEVLQQQPESIRSFLLQTSILTRLGGPLCDAVTAQENSKERLTILEHDNLFVVPLDDNRQWYRYQHLFADVLQTNLKAEQADQVPILHLRASKWYEENDSPADAIRHAFAAKNVECAARLIELAWPAMDGSFQTGIWMDWTKRLPEEVIQVRPVICVGIAWAYLNDGELEVAGTWLQVAEQWLGDSPKKDDKTLLDERVVIDEEQFRFLPASIATARAYTAQALGDLPGSASYSQQALDFLPEDDHVRRGPAAALLGLTQWANGELEAAHNSIADAMVNFRQAGQITFAVSGTYGLTDIRISQGRLRDAIQTYEQALQLVKEQGESVIPGTADLHLGLGEIYHEQGKWEIANQQLKISEDLGEAAALPDWPCRLCIIQARIKKSEGDFNAALDLLSEAEKLYYRTPIPDLRPIAAKRVQVLLKQGQLKEALSWVRTNEISAKDDLSYLREFEHITLARVLISEHIGNPATGSVTEANYMLERLLKAAEEGERKHSVIEILILLAIVQEVQDEIPSALVVLKQALILAEPEGYFQIFIDEGDAMNRLLSEALAQNILPGYVSKLLTGFKNNPAKQPLQASHSASSTMVEPLSKRELEVLQLIAQGHSNQEISERLFLALTTVKGHNRNIYGKLDVQRRTEAVARARELGLISQ